MAHNSAHYIFLRTPVEEKAANALGRCAVLDPVAFLAGLNRFHALRATNQTDLKHPAFLTAADNASARKRHLRRKHHVAKAGAAKPKAFGLTPLTLS